MNSTLYDAILAEDEGEEHAQAYWTHRWEIDASFTAPRFL